MAKFQYGLNTRQWMARQDALAGRKQSFFAQTGYRPHDMQLRVHHSAARRRVMCWGRQMGKTTTAAFEVALVLMQDLARVWIVAPEYAETDKLYDMVCRVILSEEPIDTTMPDSRGLGLRPTRHVKTQGSKLLALPWGATLQVKSTKDVTTKKLAGETLNALAWDECAYSPETAWNRLQPMLAVRQGWAMFTSTPNGDNHFRTWWERGWPDDVRLPEGNYKEIESGRSPAKDPMWESFYAATREVIPWMPQMEADLDEYQRTLTKETYEQEYMAFFRSFVGQVYKEWDSEKHVSDEICAYRHDLPLALSFDFGATQDSPFVCLWYQWTEEGEIHIIREYVCADRNTVDNGNEVMRLNEAMMYKRPSFFAADSSGLDQIKILRQHCKLRAQHRHHIPRNRREIKWGIEQIRVMLRGAEIGRDREGSKIYRPLLYVHPDCVFTQKEFGTYSYPKERTSLQSPDIPVKKNDHAMDACLVAGTRVTCPGEDYPIETIRQGDLVLTRKGPREVLRSRLTRENAAVYRVEFADGNSLIGTAEHPVWVRGQGFTRLALLEQEDELLREDGSFVDAVGRVCNAGLADVYNLEVAGEPEYFANGILVHNCRYFVAVWIGKFGLAPALRAVAELGEGDKENHSTLRHMLENTGKRGFSTLQPSARYF